MIRKPPSETRTHAENLDHLAAVAVQCRPRPQARPRAGHDRVHSTPLPLARRITEHAYRAGASLVTTLFTDEESALLRYRFAPTRASIARPAWLYDGMAAAFKSGAARLAITGANPALLSNEDPGQSGPRQSRHLEGLPSGSRADHATRNQLDHRCRRHSRMGRGRVPRRPARRRLAKLWEAIFATTRINTPDPVSAWKTHDADLHKRAALSE